MRIKLFLVTILAVVAFLLPGSIALASDISNALFKAVIRVTNDGDTTTGVSANLSLNTTALVENEFAGSASDFAMQVSGTDVAFMPGYEGNPWALWVATISSGQNIDYDLYMGNVTGGKICYFPGSGGMTTTDNETLELGDNFTIEQKGWVDTSYSVNKSLVLKQNAFRTYISATGNITSEITGGAFPTVAATNGGNNAADLTDHTVNLPAGISSSDLLLVFFASDDAPVISFPGGWTQLFQDVFAANIKFGAWYRIADGTEGANITATTSNAQMTAHTSYRITGYSGVPEAGVSVGNNGINPDPPNLAAPWGALNTLWFACAGYNDGRLTVNAYPANYTNGRNDRSNIAGGSGVGTARRERNIAAEDPGSFTLSAAQDFVANTIAIAPALSVTATGVTSGNMTVRTDTYGNVTGGLGFDGITNVVNCGNDASLQITDNITVEYWLYLDAFPGGYNTVLGKGWWGDGQGAYYFMLGPAGQFHWEVVTAGRNIWNVATLSIETWYHIVATYCEDTGLMECYINTAYYSNTVAAAAIQNSPDSFTIDGYDATHLIDGTYDEIRIYNRVITSGEVTASYNNGVGRKDPVDSTDLVAHWHIDNGRGSTIFDETTDNDGTITGATWTQGHVPSQFSISIDGVQQDGTRDDVVPPTANDWTFVQNYSMMYLEYQIITINGTEAQRIIWEYNDEFDDLSANSNNATPTFRTTSSDPDVSASMISFQPIDQARVSTFTLVQESQILTGNLTAASQMYSEANYSKIIGADAVNVLLDEGEIPRALWWYPFLFISIAIIGMITYGATRLGGANGSLLTMCIVIEVLLALFGIMNPIPFWPAILFPIPAIALIVSQKHQVWG